MSGTDYTTTPNLGLYKPIRNKAVGTWGDLWNSNVDTIDALGGPSGSLSAKAFVQDTPPANPLPGQLWFDSSNPQLYVWFVDPTSAQWVIATAYAGGLTTDAPSDGQTYGRQNGAWQNITSAPPPGGPFLPLAGGTITAPDATAALTINASNTPSTQAALTVNATNIQTTADHHYNRFTATVDYTADSPGGDNLGFASYMVMRPNGHNVFLSGHTCAIYGNAFLGGDGNAASHCSFLSGVMGASGSNGPGILDKAVDFYGHPDYNTGGGTLTTHYFLFQAPSTAATNEYGAYFTAPVSIGVDPPSYNLDIYCPAGGNVSATNALRVQFTGGVGNFVVRSTGTTINPGYALGAGGFGAQDMCVGTGVQNALTATVGFMYLSSTAGTPTGVPVQAAPGRVPIMADTTGQRLWMFMGGAWRDPAAPSAAGFLSLTGGTVSGNLTALGTLRIGDGTGAAIIQLAGAFGQVRGYQILSNTAVASGVRWQIGAANGASEPGSNVGTDFGLNSYTDTGVFLGQPIVVTRATGLLLVNNGMQFSGNAASTTDLTRHIALSNTANGFNLTAGRINYVSGAATVHTFIVGSTDTMSVGSTGMRVIGNVGFYNTAPVAKPTVSGAKGSNAALGSLIAALVAQGLVTDTTTA